jgi:AraC-like DNA-binding protein
MENEQEVVFPDIQYITFRKCTPAWRMPEHVLEPWDITYLIQGNAHYRINGTDYHAAAGDLLCLPPGSMRQACTFPDKLMHCFSVDFWLCDLIRKTEGGGITQLPFPVLSHIGVKKDLLLLFHNLAEAWLDRQQGHVLKTNGLFLLILHRLFELNIHNIDSTSVDFRINKIKRYIEQHFEEDLPVKKLAAMIKLNDVYFDSLFKQETGVSLHQYLIKVRIRNAENMLRSGEYKVSEAAELCGYSDVLHFSKQFKAVLGFPPSKCIPRWGNTTTF